MTNDIKLAECVGLAADEKAIIYNKHVGDGVVECSLTFKASKDAVREQVKFSFDFSNMTSEETEVIAANYLKIRVQDAYRRDSSFALLEVFDVKELMAKKRVGGGNPMKSAKTQIAKMSSEEKASLLRDLQASLT